MLMPDDFRAYSKVKIDNQSFNKENLPSHFKVKCIEMKGTYSFTKLLKCIYFV